MAPGVGARRPTRLAALFSALLAALAPGTGSAIGPPPAQSVSPQQAQTVDRLIGNWRVEWGGRKPDQSSFAFVSVKRHERPDLFYLTGGAFLPGATLSSGGYAVTGGVSPDGEVKLVINMFGTSTLRMRPDGSMAGQWQSGDQKGSEVWQRQEFFADRARVSVGNVPLNTAVPVALGKAPVRVELDSSTRPVVVLDVYSPNAWGTYASAIDPPDGLNIQSVEHVCQGGDDYMLGGWGYCHSNGMAVHALRYRIGVGAQAAAGRRELTIGNYRLPFELVLTNKITPELRFVMEGPDGYTPVREVPFYRQFRIEARYPTRQTGTTREATLSWAGASTPRKVILTLMADGVFRSDPLRVEPPK